MASTDLKPEWIKLRPTDIRPGHTVVAAQSGRAVSKWSEPHTVAKTRYNGNMYSFLLPTIRGYEKEGGYWWSCVSDMNLWVLPTGDPEDGEYGP